MNIFEQFESDLDAEVEGVWVELGDGAEVRVARLNNARHNKVLDRLRRPYRNHRNIPDDVNEKIATQAMAEAILLDWKGIEDRDGNPISYSTEKAIELLSDPAMKNFRNRVAYIALEEESFRKASLDAAAKNSGSSLSGA